MGSGKTTIGKELSNVLNIPFIDIDDYIEKKNKTTISEMFSIYGEEYFREREKEAVKEISSQSGFVIAAGGGTVLCRENVNMLKLNGKIILLDVSVYNIKQRLINDNSRPLINAKDKENIIENLFSIRHTVYQSVADIVVDGNNSPNKVIDDIIKSL